MTKQNVFPHAQPAVDRGDARPLDRIFVNNYVRAFEIGAYAEEHGVSQRIRFDIVLEIGAPGDALGADDNVKNIVSYDDLIGAIEALINGPRLNLLETLAERLASACLVHPRACRVHVRLEKLDRLDGDAGLGVEIARDRRSG